MHSVDTTETIRVITPARQVREEVVYTHTEEHEKKGSGVGMLLFWLILVFIIVFILLALFAPTWVLNPSTGQVDWGKVALTSFIVALIVVIIVWLVQSARR